MCVVFFKINKLLLHFARCNNDEQAQKVADLTTLSGDYFHKTSGAVKAICETLNDTLSLKSWCLDMFVNLHCIKNTSIGIKTFMPSNNFLVPET